MSRPFPKVQLLIETGPSSSSSSPLCVWRDSVAWWGLWEVCCPDSFYLCIAQVVRSGAATSPHPPPLILGMADDHWLRHRERANWAVWRVPLESVLKKCHLHTSAPCSTNLTQTGPTKIWAELSLSKLWYKSLLQRKLFFFPSFLFTNDFSRSDSFFVFTSCMWNF